MPTRDALFLMLLMVAGCGFCGTSPAPSGSSDVTIEVDLSVEDQCDFYEVETYWEYAEPPGDKSQEGMLALCEIWRDGGITDEEFAHFCLMDFDARDEIIDLEAYCSYLLEDQNLDDYATTLEDWRLFADDVDCGFPTAFHPARFAGECANGLRVLVQTDGLHREYRLYDGDSGDFVGLESLHDFWTAPCCGILFWPSKLECPDGTITEVICGTSYQAGDELALPSDF